MSLSAVVTMQRTRAARVAATVLALAAVALAPCNDPQSPLPAGDATYSGAFQSGTLEFRLDGAGGVSALRLVATDLEFDATTEILTAQVALLNTSGATMPGPGSILVSDFDPESVRPTNAACIECANCPLVCAFDHAGSYGDDGVLGAGETSEPRPWAFHVPGGTGFAFRARIPADPTPGPGIIAGLVFLDFDADGQHDRGEPGMPGRPLQLEHDGTTRTTATDDNGHFAFMVHTPGLYVVELLPTDFCLETTPPRIQVFIVRRPDGSLSGYDGARFGCRGDTPPDSGVAVNGFVFVDHNRSGVRDRGEPGLAGVLVVGSVPSCPTFAPIEARTDAGGHYSMHLPHCPPPYDVHREPLVGYDDTTPNPLVFTEPAREIRADFGVAPSDSSNAESFIDGFVFFDLDDDGQWDRGEPGVADVPVTASGLLCLTPVSAISHTDAGGRYRIRGNDVHCPLPWIVQQGPPSPGCGETSSNPVILRGQPGDPPAIFRVDFGFRPCPPTAATESTR